MPDTNLKPAGPVRLKRNHPWASKASGAWLFNDYAFRNIADPNSPPSILNTNGGSPSIVGAKDGFALLGAYARVETPYTASRLGINGNRKRTILLDYQHLNDYVSGVLLQCGGTEWSGAEFCIAKLSYGSCTFWGYYADSQFTVTPGNVDHRVQLAVTYDGTNIGWYAICKGSDGTNKYSGSVAINVNTTDSNKLVFMRGVFDHTDSFQNQMYSAVIIPDMVLTATEIEKYFAAPYDIYEPMSQVQTQGRTRGSLFNSIATTVGNVYSASIAEVARLIDTITNVFTARSTSAEIVIAVDTPSTADSVASTSAESVSATESVANTAIVSSISEEGAAVMDAPSAAVKTNSAMSEAVASSETLSTIQTQASATAESSSIVDSSAYTSNNTSSNAESISVVEVGNTTLSASNNLIENVAPVDVNNGLRTSTSTQSESVVLTDVENTILQAVSSFSDSLPVSDFHSVGSSASISNVAESTTLSDSLTSQGQFNVGYLDSVNITDSYVSASQAISSWLDSVGLSDSTFVAGVTMQAYGADALTSYDVTSALQIVTAQRSDSLTTSDVVSSFLGSVAPPVTIDAGLIPQSRWIKFEGNVRIVKFEGIGRVIAFEGTNRTVVFEGNSRVIDFKDPS